MTYSPNDSDWNADSVDDEWDDEDEDWVDDDRESPTVECPKCGADMYEDVVQCPLCGEYVTHVHPVWQGKPLWWKLLGLVGIVAIIWALTLAM